ncbi:MAG: DUF4395 domain-containing protein [Actinobacteria bacterium]|jgi:Domain of unknown function (DUF4395)|nr:DUF4395 domain-containing protein [Actinomycetota bacterium]NCW91637.1 DUF4395 domain-containing protein [Acidimicrobiia bacterium]NCZ86685.1 DUF4395 domain-containing protein [Actinomycetota bacterium]NDC11382.1 DUF4395 domain-containing protein [Actinomycetota bacterium]NDD61828.1 DUF4395 domain-containing protein [Actinomycetota bacterium]
MSKRFPFPHPVNETSARLVAAGVVVMGTAYAVTGAAWLLVPLVYGFLARVSTGPAFSPLALLATKVLTPRIKTDHRMVAGPPKRFAQFVGLVFTSTAAVLWLFDFGVASRVVAAALVAAAVLESVFAICLGCIMFSWMMRLGVIPQRVCEECNNLQLRASTSA